jgi:hypothetical protein
MGLNIAHQPRGVSVVKSASAPILISCFEQDDTRWCRLAAIVLTELHPSLEVLHRILQLNNNVLLGSFRLFEDRTLVFSATLHGDNLDADAFATTLRYVASIADSHGPELVGMAQAHAGNALLRSPPCG